MAHRNDDERNKSSFRSTFHSIDGPNQVPETSSADKHHSSFPALHKHTRNKSPIESNYNQNENQSNLITWKTNHDKRQSRVRDSVSSDQGSLLSKSGKSKKRSLRSPSSDDSSPSSIDEARRKKNTKSGISVSKDEGRQSSSGIKNLMELSDKVDNNVNKFLLKVVDKVIQKKISKQNVKDKKKRPRNEVMNSDIPTDSVSSNKKKKRKSKGKNHNKDHDISFSMSSSDEISEKASAQPSKAGSQHSPSSVSMISSDDFSPQPSQACSKNTPSSLSLAAGVDNENVASTSRKSVSKKASHKEKERRASRSSRHRERKSKRIVSPSGSLLDRASPEASLLDRAPPKASLLDRVNAFINWKPKSTVSEVRKSHSNSPKRRHDDTFRDRRGKSGSSRNKDSPVKDRSERKENDHQEFLRIMSDFMSAPTSAEKSSKLNQHQANVNPPNPELLQYQLSQPPPGVLQSGFYPNVSVPPGVSYQGAIDPGVMYPGASASGIMYPVGSVPGVVHQGVSSAIYPSVLAPEGTMYPAASGPRVVQGLQQPTLGLPTPVPSQPISSSYQGIVPGQHNYQHHQGQELYEENHHWPREEQPNYDLPHPVNAQTLSYIQPHSENEAQSLNRYDSKRNSSENNGKVGGDNEDCITVTFGRSLDSQQLDDHGKRSRELTPINEVVYNMMNNSRVENQTSINEVYNQRRSDEYYANQESERRSYQQERISPNMPRERQVISPSNVRVVTPTRPQEYERNPDLLPLSPTSDRRPFSSRESRSRPSVDNSSLRRYDSGISSRQWSESPPRNERKLNEHHSPTRRYERGLSTSQWSSPSPTRRNSSPTKRYDAGIPTQTLDSSPTRSRKPSKNYSPRRRSEWSQSPTESHAERMPTQQRSFPPSRRSRTPPDIRAYSGMSTQQRSNSPSRRTITPTEQSLEKGTYSGVPTQQKKNSLNRRTRSPSEQSPERKIYSGKTSKQSSYSPNRRTVTSTDQNLERGTYSGMTTKQRSTSPNITTIRPTDQRTYSGMSKQQKSKSPNIRYRTSSEQSLERGTYSGISTQQKSTSPNRRTLTPTEQSLERIKYSGMSTQQRSISPNRRTLTSTEQILERRTYSGVSTQKRSSSPNRRTITPTEQSLERVTYSGMSTQQRSTSPNMSTRTPIGDPFQQRRYSGTHSETREQSPSCTRRESSALRIPQPQAAIEDERLETSASVEHLLFTRRTASPAKPESGVYKRKAPSDVETHSLKGSTPNENMLRLKEKASKLLEISKEPIEWPIAKKSTHDILSKFDPPKYFAEPMNKDSILNELQVTDELRRLLIIDCPFKDQDNILACLDQIKSIVEITTKKSSTTFVIRIEVLLVDLKYVGFVKNFLSANGNIINKNQITWEHTGAEVICSSQLGYDVEIINITMKTMKVFSTDVGIKQLLFKICVQGRIGFYEKIIRPHNGTDQKILDLLNIKLDETTFSVYDQSVQNKDVISVTKLFNDLSVVASESEASLCVLMTESWDEMRLLAQLYSTLTNPPTELVRSIKMLGVLNNHRMGTDSTFNDSPSTTERNLEQTLLLRQIEQPHLQTLLSDNCIPSKLTDFLSVSSIPAVVAKKFCFVTVEFCYDEVGEMRLLELEYTISDVDNTLIYRNSSICSKSASKATQFKGKLCSETDAIAGFLEAVQNTCKNSDATLVVFSCYLTLPILLYLIKRNSLEIKFYFIFKSVIQFVSLSIGLKQDSLGPCLDNQSTNGDSVAMLNFIKNSPVRLGLAKAAVPMSDVRFNHNFAHFQVKSKKISIIDPNTIQLNCKFVFEQEELRKCKRKDLVFMPCFELDNVKDIEISSINLTSKTVIIKLKHSGHLSEENLGVPMKIVGFIQSDPYKVLIPRIIPHVFYTQRAVKSTGLELTVALPNMPELINNTIPNSIIKVNQEKQLQVKTVSSQDPRLSRARLSTENLGDNSTPIITKKHAEFSWTSWNETETQRKNPGSVLSKHLVQKESSETASPSNESQTKKIKTDISLQSESKVDQPVDGSVKNIKQDGDSVRNIKQNGDSDKNTKPGSDSVKNIKPKVKKGDPDITFDVSQLVDDDDDADMDIYEPPGANANIASEAPKDSHTAEDEYEEIPSDMASKLLDKKLFASKLEFVKDNNDAIESEPVKETSVHALKNVVPDRFDIEVDATVFTNDDGNMAQYLHFFSSLTTCPNYTDFAIAYLKVKGASDIKTCDEIIEHLDSNLELDSIQPLLNIIKDQAVSELNPDHVVRLIQEDHELFNDDISTHVAAEVLIYMFNQKYPDYHDNNVQKKNKVTHANNKQTQARGVNNKQPPVHNLYNKLPQRHNVNTQKPQSANTNNKQPPVFLDNNKPPQPTNIQNNSKLGNKKKQPKVVNVDDIEVVGVVTDHKHGKNQQKRRSTSSPEYVISDEETDNGTKAGREAPEVVQIEPGVSSKSTIQTKNPPRRQRASEPQQFITEMTSVAAKGSQTARKADNSRRQSSNDKVELLTLSDDSEDDIITLN